MAAAMCCLHWEQHEETDTATRERKRKGKPKYSINEYLFVWYINFFQ